MTEDIFSEVVNRGLCIGCGACASVQNEALRMVWNDEGFLEPARNEDFVGSLDQKTLAVCPFYDDGRDEDWLSERLFGGALETKRDRYIGRYLGCFIGHCTDDSVRSNATSGGIIGWTIRALLKANHVQRVVALGYGSEPDRLFDFKVFRSIGELDRPMKSRYYPTEFSAAVRSIIAEPGSTAFVGLPCQVKALRKMALELPELDERLIYTVSLFCGHQKSRHYTEYLAMQASVEPNSVKDVDYRRKREGQPANDYGYEITYHEGNRLNRVTGATREVFASSWSNNLFMNPACEYCDDVVGETADLSVGDAWLAEHIDDWRGTSICVVRHPELRNLLFKGIQDGELRLAETTPQVVYRSQEGGFRQRREALQYRLALAARKGRRVPRKRVEPSTRSISLLDRLQQRIRIRLRKTSNRVFRRSNPNRGTAALRRDLLLFLLISRYLVVLRRIERRLTSRRGRATCSEALRKASTRAGKGES